MAAGDESEVDVTPVPPLPPRLDDPRPLVAAGIVAWSLAALVLAVLGSTGTAFWTCVAGGAGAYRINAEGGGAKLLRTTVPPREPES